VVHPLSNLLRCGVCGGMMRIKRCDSRTTSWSRRYYVCASRARSFKCANEIHLPADEVEQKLTAHLADSVLGQIEASIRASIRGEIQRILDSTGAREEQATQLRDEIESLRRERQRLVRLAAATDDPVPEVVDALSTNHERAKALQEALAKATRPPIDPALAERLEAVAVAQVVRMREQLAAGELREALTVLFPAGLRFKVAGGLWLIEGAASVPTVRQPDTIRIPVATSRSTVISRDASS
ncbi:MAG TPA: zinc ribbon domain-containing protein, partial [Polyangia bacterium]